MIIDWVKVGFFSGFIFLLTVCASHAGSLHDQWMNDNTAPVGQVSVSGASAQAPAASAALSGAERYKASCSFCHDVGAAGAPKLGVKAAWAPRLAKGEDKLVYNAIHGIGAMPAKGMCPTCSDDEIKATVQYMISQVK